MMAYDWQTRGCSQYGADMGRTSDLPFDTTVKLTLRRVYLDAGGYDTGGAYWGTDARHDPETATFLWCVFDEDGATCYLRERSAEHVHARFPGATWTTPTEPTGGDVDDMLASYMETALWSSTGSPPDCDCGYCKARRKGKASRKYLECARGDESLDSYYSTADIDDTTRAAMRADCQRFAVENAATIVACMAENGSLDWQQAGHDFWLTRCGHGCGFWDGDWPKEAGRILTNAAHAFGDVWLLPGDDGKVGGF